MNTKSITKGAIMVALATVLSYIKVYTLPNGGSITAASMVPIIFIALSCDFRTAIMTSLTYSVIQMMIGFYPPPTQDFISFMIVILCDYVIAFGVLGLAGVIAKPFGNKKAGAAFATVMVTFIRFVCHYISGITIWSSYAPEGTPVWLYSLTYNGSYMLLEGIISVIVIMFIWNSIRIKQ